MKLELRFVFRFCLQFRLRLRFRFWLWLWLQFWLKGNGVMRDDFIGPFLWCRGIVLIDISILGPLTLTDGFCVHRWASPIFHPGQ